MQRRSVLLLVVAAVLTTSILGWFAWTRFSGTRIVPIADLRAGTSFFLGSIHFQQVDFTDQSAVDGPISVSFDLSFPDGVRERFEFNFGGFCPSGSVDEKSTAHREPAATFRHVCGDDVIRIRVA